MEGRRPPLLPRAAVLLSSVPIHYGLVRERLPLADVLGEGAGEGVREREDLGGAEACRLAAADPRELADHFFEPPLSRQRRREPQHERNQPPERLCDGHSVGAALADLDEDLEGIIVWRLVDRDERGADRGIGPVGRALEAVRARPDDRGRRGRHRYLLLDADVQDLLALAAVAEDRDAKAAELPREQVRARNVLLARAVRQVDGLRDAVVGVALKRRLMAHVPLVADLVRGPEDPPRVFGHARDRKSTRLNSSH